MHLAYSLAPYTSPPEDAGLAPTSPLIQSTRHSSAPFVGLYAAMAGFPITTSAGRPPSEAMIGELHAILSFDALLHSCLPFLALSARIFPSELF